MASVRHLLFLLFFLSLLSASATTFARSNGQYVCQNTQTTDHNLSGEFIAHVALDKHATTVAQSDDAISITYDAPGTKFTTNYFGDWKSIDGQTVFQATSSAPNGPLNWNNLVLTDSGHITIRPTLNGFRASVYECNQVSSTIQPTLKNHQNKILQNIQNIKDSWINVQRDLRPGETCMVRGTKVNFTYSNLSSTSIKKIAKMQTVLAVFEDELDFPTYFEATLTLTDGSTVKADELRFQEGTFDYSNWRDQTGWPGKWIDGLIGAQFLTAFMQQNAEISLMLSEGIGKMPKPDDFMNIVFRDDQGFTIPFDITQAGLDKDWIDCVSNIAARVTERRKKNLGLD